MIHNDSSRGLRGGSWPSYDGQLAAKHCSFYPANTFDDGIGFRVAFVPEPGSLTLLLVGGLCLAAYAWRRKR